MLLILLSLIVYVLLSCLVSNLLLSLSLPLFMVVVYVVTVILNLIVTKYQQTDRANLTSTLILPVFSTLFFISFAYLSLDSGYWMDYVHMNSITDSEMSVEISANLLDISQIVFAVLVYFGSSIAFYLILKFNKNLKDGVKYA